MTGGQHSGFTPSGFKTATTSEGNLLAPLRVIDLLNTTEAGFLARVLATDSDLDDIIASGVGYCGFSLIEEKKQKNKFIKIKKDSKTDISFSVIIAGTAGEGVQFAARLLHLSAVLSGLWGIQKNDNPVTVGSGFSMSELKLSSSQINSSQVDSPDYLLVTSREGCMRVQNIFSRLSCDFHLILDASLPKPKTKARVIPKSFVYSKGSKNIMAVGFLVNIIPELSIKFLKQAVKFNSKNVDRLTEVLNGAF